MIGRAAVVLVGAMAVAAAAEPRRDEFAYAAPITLEGAGSVHRAPLTTTVYQGVTRADLGDLRVYNGAGEMVPHGLRRPAIEPIKNMTRLPVFPLSLNRDPTARDVSLHVEVAKDGSIVNVRSGNGPAAEEPLYLLDVSRIEQPLAALEVEWEGEAGGGIRLLKVEASDDLKSWRTVGQGALTKLTHAGQVLERKRVEFPPQRMRYARLLWADPSLALNLTSVKGEFTSFPEVEREWLAPERNAGARDQREQRFQLNGVMPVDRARVILPPNSVARASVLYRRKDGDPWVRAGEKTVYVLETANGTIQDNELRFLYGIYASQWLLRVSGRSGADAYGNAGLELGWVPHELVFVARGKPPFSLAYGLAGLGPVDFGVNELMPLVERGNEPLALSRAVLGASREQKGEAARSATWSLADWKHVLLWTVLLAGVGSLALLAVRLGKQLRSEP